MSARRSSRFSPRIVAPDVLESLFVGRRQLLEHLVEDVMTTVAGGGARFELVVGPRGAGKSHLIALVAHRLSQHPRRGELVLLELGEEEYPASLVDLVARLIAVAPEAEGVPAREVQLARLRAQPLDQQLEVAIAMLSERIGERPVVLVIENIDRVFDAIGTAGQSRLRGLLAERRRWSVVASSCAWSWAFGDVRAPFYRMFHKIELPPFDEREAHGMLVRLAEVHEDEALLSQLQTPKGFARVRALRFLVGGSPRAMALLFPFLRSRRLDDIEGMLLDLADELTPYFQDQVSRLPAGQRPYVEHLLASWTPLSVGELAALTFSTPQTASGQLRYLVRDHVVVASTVGRQRFYEIGEPLHRLAAAMKRPERLPAVIVRFLTAWLEREELSRRWSAGGGAPDDEDPLFLALDPPREEVTDFELALVEEAQALAEQGRSDESVGALRTEWEKLQTPFVGMALMIRLSGADDTAAIELANELLSRFDARTAQPVLMMGLRHHWPVEVLEQARQRLVERGTIDRNTAFALLAEGGAPIEMLHRCVEVLTSEGLSPGLVDAIESHSPFAAWALASGRVHELDLRDRLAALRAAGHLGVVADVSASVWLDGLRDGDLAAMEIALELERGQIAAAAREAIEAVREHPEHHKLRDLAGLALWGAGRGPEALPHAEWLVERYPEVVRYRRDLVDILVHLDRPAEALQVLQRAPPLDGLHEPRIKALAASGMWEKAAERAVEVGVRLASVAEVLRDAARGEPVSKSIAVGDGALMTFFLRQIADGTDRGAIVRRLGVFRTADDAWRAVIERGLTVALEEDIAFRLSRPGWGHVVDVLGDLGILHPRFVAAAHAMLMLPDPAPFLRLAASERGWIRALLADSDAGRALPAEPG